VSPIKEAALKAIDNLPDDASIEDINYGIYILTRLEQARQEVAEGHLIDHDIIEQKMKKWIIE
jgi:hypothetical protein